MDREAQVAKLKSGVFDILVIGGGATGSGIALDAVSRALNVGLVERGDFACGTSSRSTKLIHGGVRYLEHAVLKFDRSQFRLVRDALKERAILLKIAPHLARWLPLLVPLYKRFESSYYMTGLRLYDRLAGRALAHKSSFVSTAEAMKRCPFLNPDGLRGGAIYYDGQFDDARMNVSIAMTASELGAAVANYVEVVSLKKAAGKTNGVTVRDLISGETWDISAKIVINATGPFSDAIRKLDDPKAESILQVSSGVHIVLDKKFSPADMGLLIPKTEDGRVLFLLPWQGHTLVGTTDNPAKVNDNPKATQEDIDYILRQLASHFNLPIHSKDILAVWSGLRPLVTGHSKTTASLSRDHVIDISKSGVLTIAGGKWTTYRLMASDAVETALKHHEIKNKQRSLTSKIRLAGADQYSPDDSMKLCEVFGIDAEVAEHLNQSYGDRAGKVAEWIKGGFGARLVSHFPYLEAEVVYAIKEESARFSIDVLARRTRLAFLDRKATEKALPRVQAIMAQHLKWDDKQKAIDSEMSRIYLG